MGAPYNRPGGSGSNPTIQTSSTRGNTKSSSGATANASSDASVTIEPEKEKVKQSWRFSDPEPNNLGPVPNFILWNLLSHCFLSWKLGSGF